MGPGTRSRIRSIAAIVHFVYVGVIAATSIYCFWRAHIISVSAAPDAAKHLHSMLFAGSVIGLAGLTYIVTAFGLWRARRWGFWLSIIANGGIITLFVSDMVGNYQVDTEDWAGMIAFSFPLLLTLWTALNRSKKDDATLLVRKRDEINREPTRVGG